MKKKILIISPISVFPKESAIQERIYLMIKTLCKQHTVDLAYICRTKEEEALSEKKLSGYCNKIYSIKAVNPADNFLRRKFYGIRFVFENLFFHYPADYFYFNKKKYLDELNSIVQTNDYDIVQIEYWYMAPFINKLNKKVTTVIDTVDILYDKMRQKAFHIYGDKLPSTKQKELIKYEELEKQHLEYADVLISISTQDSDKLNMMKLANEKLYVPIGQEVEHFINYPRNDDGKTILFYGSMGGRENIDAFFRFWKNIYPIVKQKIPDVKVNIVGANPPDSIKTLSDNKTVFVTGFVDDVRPHLAKSSLLMVPLNVAAGFRGRVVDVMSMQIPVVGTSKALDCVGIKSGVEGFISDIDSELADYTINLLMENSLRKKMGEASLKFVKENYSIEATYDNLSEYYGNIEA